MNFFGYQEKARRNSAILVALFVLGTLFMDIGRNTAGNTGR